MLNFVDDKKNIIDNTDALDACIDSLHKGHIVAVKGIGGYHLMCDATNDEAVKLFGHTVEDMKGKFFGEALKLFKANGKCSIL